jgi:hypothetical protein
MGDNNSSVAGGAYMIMHPPSAAPVFSPGTGPYASAQMVTISTTTSGATIRYTTDGSIPTETTGNLYSGPLALGSTTTLKAIAYKSGFTDSPVTSGLYSFTQVAAPVFSSASGHAVMITTATGSATIRYTTDGSVPSETNGTIYTAPVTITAPTTLKAIAYETGFTDSPVTSSTIGIPTVTITTPANGSTINN